MPKKHQPTVIPADPQWYKQAVIYQLHVRAFHDSDANGIGDFRGLTSKLDYLQGLGVTALWLLPFYPSPLKDDGYDIADYFSINPIYGTLADFKVFLREAHARRMRVITEMVLNHTSDQHAWFQRARRARPGSRWRDYYVWNDTPDKYKDVRIIFKDFEPSNWAWDPLAKAHYWHRFFSHQPDLNFDSPHVHKEIFRVLDFWMDMGVDGLRLDAIPYLYEREGTSCENLPETHAFLKTIRQHLDTRYGDRMLLAEANLWPESAVTYFGAGRGDECHMAFHFPLMPRLFMAVRMEDRMPIVDILDQTPALPETSQWALFLRNHDELTLEMVTDEERDYMYRVYAQQTQARINLGIRRRLAPLLGNDRKRIELLTALLLSLPGTPVIYYGDEIGMGDNVFLGDRHSMRTPMQWSSDKNAGFSRANPQSLYLPIALDPEYHYEAVNVEAQDRNPHSLLWWMRRLLALRKRWRAFGLGTIEFLQPENRKILAFIRRHENECVLVVCNLSRFVQPVELDLAAFQQRIPVELFGRTSFPPVTERPYFLTLSPHSFCWFSLEPRFAETQAASPAGAPVELPVLKAQRRWEELLDEPARPELEQCLQTFLTQQHWFAGAARQIKTVSVSESVAMPTEPDTAVVAFVEVEYVEGDPEKYLVPLAFAVDDEAERVLRESPRLVIARVELARANRRGVLLDALGSRGFNRMLFEAMSHRRRFRDRHGELETSHTPQFRLARRELKVPLEPVLIAAEQRNSSVVFGDKFMLKLFRRLEAGPHPELEMGRFLARHNFAHMPPVVGTLEFHRTTGETVSLGVLHMLITNSQNGWDYTLDALGRYFERINTLPPEAATAPRRSGSFLALAGAEIPPLVTERLGTFVETARLLGERTAALHLALASDPDDPDFAPEPMTPYHLRSLFQSMRNQATEVFGRLRQRLKHLPDALRAPAEQVAALQPEIIKRFRALSESRFTGARIRVHGDYWLGQVLHTGMDFVIIDFEGDPARPLSQRRLKRTPFRDVTSMLRSFHHAAAAALAHEGAHGPLSPESAARLEPWAQFWHQWAGVIFLQGYFKIAGRAAFMPQVPDEVKVIFEAHLLNKLVAELGRELTAPPERLKIPMQAVLELLTPEAG